ncbi:MAG TPA: DnaJ domain-containing protein [Bryobacteraceae bacterium]|nr:DnaJ domain-containing protein [Bryobacteraceae bacterium]
MASSQRPGEITYYEELGVEETASADEIRDAFRTLVRLLHPDQQSDPQLREMAERQMRKLNRVYAVLSDPDRRTAYNEALDEPHNAAPIIVFSGADGNLKKLIVRVAAFAGIVLGSALLIWFMATSNGNDGRVPEAHASSARSADGPDDPGDQIARLRDQLRSAEGERDSALEQLEKLGGKAALARAHEAETASASKAASLVAEKEPPPRPTETQEPPANSAQFTGLWVFTKGNGSASPGGKSQYSPEYIELTVSQQNGALHGQYHSRYQVLDHAISPDVDFTFNGTPSGDAVSSAWQGPGGARGRVTMKLVSPGTVDLAWNSSELGSLQWLTSGDATLVKK